MCNKKGHFARNCPDRASRVNRVLHGNQNFILDAQINGVPTKALVDSGAQVTVIPAHLAPPSAYTKATWKAAGLMSEGPLPIATVTVSVGDVTTTMRVLVKEGLKEVLLGQDYPQLKQLLSQGIMDFIPLTGILGPVEDITPTEEMVRQNEEEGTQCLAAEAEEVGVLGDDGRIMAVQTRAQCRRELQQQQDDDEASASSGAVPRPVEQLGAGVTVEEDHASQQQGAGATIEDKVSAPSGPVPAEPQRQGSVESATYDLTSQRFSASEDAQIDAAWEDFAGLDESIFGDSKTRDRLLRSQKHRQATTRGQDEASMEIANLTPQQFEEAQKEDSSLDPLWRAVEDGADGYFIKGQRLYHLGEDEWGEDTAQLVIPTKFRHDILTMAHGTRLAAHLGVNKSTKKAYHYFFWPGLRKDMQAFCQTCGACQHGAKANRTKAPLQPLPAIDEPFQRVAVDIVGPLKRTKRGNRYILTLMDFASRYPEAIPLRRIDAETVADALCTTFTRFGIPQEILSDQGSQFMCTLTKRLMELLEVKQLRTSPYHPQTDGMLERFHSTLKRMLQKRGEIGKDWDEFLPYACFAYRDAVHSATGYSPFQLLFGRDVRGPLSLLRSQLIGETTGSRLVVDFMERMKNRLHLAWKTAKENDEEAKRKSKNYQDKKACRRIFNCGDQVLVFEPGEDKFSPLWHGPYTVEERVNDLTYRIATPERRKQTRQFHINSLKEWKPPLSVMTVTFCDEEDENTDDTYLELQPYDVSGDEDVRCNEELTPDKLAALNQIKESFKDVFRNCPGNTPLLTHAIETGEAKPVFHHPRRIPLAWRDKVKEEVDTMLKSGVIEPSHSPWTSPIVPVKKKEGGLRLCIDYRNLNRVTVEDRYQVNELVERIGRAEFISTLDLCKGYYQVPMRAEDKPKTAFLTPFGKFQFCRMPFGLKGAPSTFQRLMDKVLDHCRCFADAYIDDISIYSETWEEHLKHLCEVLQQLREANLTAKPSKCKLAMFKCGYLGLIVGGGEVQLEEAKVAAIRNFPIPRTKKDVRSFLGLAGYYRRFIPQFATLTANLTDLTRKEQPNKVEWTPALASDFQTLKTQLAQEPVLKCPDEDQQFIVQTDASERGIGAVLSQLDDKGEERPVAFYSKKLLPREEHYASVEKECLGIIAALKHFSVYLIGKEFVIVTDHQALQYLDSMRNSNPRLIRWALALQPFMFTVKHRPGVQNGNADGLSRQAWTQDNQPDHHCFAAEEGGGSVGNPLPTSQQEPAELEACRNLH